MIVPAAAIAAIADAVGFDITRTSFDDPIDQAIADKIRQIATAEVRLRTALTSEVIAAAAAAHPAEPPAD